MRYVRKNPPDIHKLLQDNFQIVQMTKKKKNTKKKPLMNTSADTH